MRRIQGILSFTKKYGIARVEDACAAALELEAIDYRFVRRYLERSSQPPSLSVKSIHLSVNSISIATSLKKEPRKKNPNHEHH